MKPDIVKKKKKTSWHRLLARLLELVLSPVNIEVLSDVDVMTEPPEADILLLRRQTAQWTEAQRALLPDGIRESNASHILIEFKYTQSFNKLALQQALGYDFFFKQAKQLPGEELQTVVLSARTPRTETLELLGYFKTQFAGVYRSQTPIFEQVLLLSLNDLSNEPHNAWIKCFSSKKKVKEEALKRLKTVGLISLNEELKYFVSGLREIWSVLSKGGNKMKMNFTPEQVTEFGKELGDVWLAGLKPAERLAGLKPSERLMGLKPSERLTGLKLSERLVGFEPEEIEDYLKQLKKRKH
ncbi:hypothetical protein [Candidatus Parabeggiatoa sp. HSG14]|uniref:hypothetical protein n=1 Tax=Candidatus Parabeggiatoa sp. HSG14 TaxID=3055593 RepID=UPI0025A82F35|nr:hypothetical protein [Thiotrichales bacterium HSG14]